MKKALYCLFTALPMISTAMLLSVWYFGIITVLPFIFIAAAVWIFAVLRAYKMLPGAGKAVLIASLWIVAIVTAISPYIVIWFAFQGGHHL